MASLAEAAAGEDLSASSTWSGHEDKSAGAPTDLGKCRVYPFTAFPPRCAASQPEQVGHLMPGACSRAKPSLWSQRSLLWCKAELEEVTYHFPSFHPL